MRTEDGLSCELHLRPFGRKGTITVAAQRPSSLADDFRLFALTFAAGFLFVSLYLA
jgi:hypothetical protein